MAQNFLRRANPGKTCHKRCAVDGPMSGWLRLGDTAGLDAQRKKAGVDRLASVAGLLALASLTTQPATGGERPDATPSATPAYYLRADGITAVAIDGPGSTRGLPTLESIARPGGAEPLIERVPPTVTVNEPDAHAIEAILPLGDSYVVRFRNVSAMAIELRVGTGSDRGNTEIVRYRDIDLPLSTPLRMTLGPNGRIDLRYDSSRSGADDRLIKATAHLTGSAALNDAPPRITITSTAEAAGSRMRISVVPGNALVTRTLYTLDGSRFQRYVGPFLLEPGHTREVIAFADDEAGNRATTSFSLSPQARP